MPIHVLKVERGPGGTWDFSKVYVWTDEYVRGRDYVILLTDENEIILEPRKSTKPSDYGYISIRDRQAVMNLAEELRRRYGLLVVEIKSLGWDVEKPPWVKVPPE
jgi:hypothetical protein